MKMMIRTALAAAVSLVALEASAGGFAVREQSTTGQGFSFAGAATSAAGLSSMYWNPAGVTALPGINFESHASLILAMGKMNPTTGSGILTATDPGTGNVAQTAIVPASYSSYQVTDSLYVGLSINSPFGLVTKSDPYSAVQYYGRTSRAFNTVATPTVGYVVNDWLSVAAGIQVGHMKVRLTQASFTAPLPGGFATAFGPNSPTSILEGDSWGVGYTLGATIKPMSGTEIGIGFRSAVHYGLKGTFSTPTSQTLIKAKLNTPEVLTIGLKQRINDQWTVLAGYEWTNWSRVGEPTVSRRLNGTTLTHLDFRYKDGWMVSLGAEYKYSPELTLRTGMAFEKSPINKNTAAASVRVPDNDRIWASIGATYNWNNKLSFDLAYSHVWVKDPNVNLLFGSSPPVVMPAANVVAKGKAHVDIISVGLRYRWDEPSRPATAALITK